MSVLPALGTSVLVSEPDTKANLMENVRAENLKFVFIATTRNGGIFAAGKREQSIGHIGPAHMVHILADISIYMQMPRRKPLCHLDLAYSSCVRAKVKVGEFSFVVFAFPETINHGTYDKGERGKN